MTRDTMIRAIRRRAIPKAKRCSHAANGQRRLKTVDLLLEESPPNECPEEERILVPVFV